MECNSHPFSLKTLISRIHCFVLSHLSTKLEAFLTLSCFSTPLTRGDNGRLPSTLIRSTLELALSCRFPGSLQTSSLDKHESAASSGTSYHQRLSYNLVIRRHAIPFEGGAACIHSITHLKDSISTAYCQYARHLYALRVDFNTDIRVCSLSQPFFFIFCMLLATTFPALHICRHT